MKDVELASIIAEQAPRMSKDMFRQLKKDIRSYLEKNNNTKYFTLMGMPSKEGNSTRYVTIFNINRDNKNVNIVDEIYNFILENETVLGTLKGYLYQKDNNYIEIWYNNECYLFYMYDLGVIEIGY